MRVMQWQAGGNEKRNETNTINKPQTKKATTRPAQPRKIGTRKNQPEDLTIKMNHWKGEWRDTIKTGTRKDTGTRNGDLQGTRKSQPGTIATVAHLSKTEWITQKIEQIKDISARVEGQERETTSPNGPDWNMMTTSHRDAKKRTGMRIAMTNHTNHGTIANREPYQETVKRRQTIIRDNQESLSTDIETREPRNTIGAHLGLEEGSTMTEGYNTIVKTWITTKNSTCKNTHPCHGRTTTCEQGDQ